MTDRPDNTRIHDWLDETIGQVPDPVESARQVMSQVDETRQVGRWLPFTVFRRKATPKTPTSNDTVDYRPSATPASNGHSPKTIRRVSPMLSPVKAITAGALAVTIGGVLLIAQPFDQQGSAPGATTDGERAAPVEFTGTWAFGGERLPASTEFLAERDLSRSQGSANYLAPSSITDPRFDGEVTIFANNDDYSTGGGSMVWGTAFRVENADGAWQSDQGYTADFADGSNSGQTTIFHGEEGYDGLVAVVGLEMKGNWFELKGVIIDGDLPPDSDARSLE